MMDTGDDRSAPVGDAPGGAGEDRALPDMTGAPEGWVRVNDLARQMGRGGRVVRGLAQAKLPAEALARVARREGGEAALWVSPAGAAWLQRWYAGEDRGSPEVTGESAPDDTGALRSQPAGAPEATGEDRGSPDGWRELAAELRAELDRERSAHQVARVGLQEALRGQAEAERGRMVAETRLEALRAALWQWWVSLERVGWWGRMRRRWPEPPAELGSERRLPPPE